MAVRRGRQFAKGVRRPVAWMSAVSANSAAVPATGAAMSIIAPSAGWTNLTTGTIVRIRGVLRAWGLLGAADTEVAGAYGIVVVKQKAATAGLASVPHPATDGNADWMYWTPLMGFMHTTAAEKTIASFPVDIIIDCKAMRKFDPQSDALIEVFQNLGADIFNVITGHHILIKE